MDQSFSHRSTRLLWRGAQYLQVLLASVRSKLPNVGSWHVKRRDIELSLESFHEKLAAPESQSIRDYIVDIVQTFELNFEDSKSIERELLSKQTDTNSNLPSGTKDTLVQSVPVTPPTNSASSAATPLSASVPLTSGEVKRSFTFEPFQSLVEWDEALNKQQAERGKFLCDSIDRILALMRDNPIWSAYINSNEDNLRDYLEDIIVPAIYDRLFIANRDRDYKFALYLSNLNFVTPLHLDIKYPISEAFVNHCGFFLTQISFEKTPHGKLSALHSCCTAIFDFLKQHISSETEGVSVDDFLPTLIYVIIRVNPFGIISQITYISSCRATDTLLQENYFLTSVDIALQFLEHLQPHQLSDPQVEQLECNWLLLDEEPESRPSVSLPNRLPRTVQKFLSNVANIGIFKR